MRHFNYILYLIGLTFLVVDCSDKDLDASSCVDCGNAIKVNSNEQYYALGVDFSKIQKYDGLSEFNNIVRNQDGTTSVYFEQNADNTPRQSEVCLYMSDGSTKKLYFSQEAYTRSSNDKDILVRSHGVGFGFLGLVGKNCDLNYLTCQIVNLNKIKNKYNEALAGEQLYAEDLSTYVKCKIDSFSNFAKYVQRTDFDIDASISIPIFRADIERKKYLVEQANKHYNYISGYANVVKSKKYISYLDIAAAAKEDCPEILTCSFRDAIKKIKDNSSNTTFVDSFLTRFGTHVITEAYIGGNLNLDAVISRNIYKDEFRDSDSTSVSVKAFISFYDKAKEESLQKENNNEDVIYNVSYEVKGGETRDINNALYNASTIKDAKTIDDKTIMDWIRSIKYDTTDVSNNNVEMVQMEIKPIYKIIPDEKVSTIVKERMLGQHLSDLSEILGDTYYANTSFPAHPTSTTCKMGGTSKTFNNPYMVNILSEDRYAATIAKEWIPEISTTDLVQVAYLIDHRAPDFSNGLCLYGGKAYAVKWTSDSISLHTLGTTASDSIYINNGILEYKRNNLLTYRPSHTVYYAEWPGSIGTDGNLQNNNGYYGCYKFLGNVYLNDASNQEFINLPNWTYKAVSANKKYQNLIQIYHPLDKFYTGLSTANVGAARTMTMDEDYQFYYNENEITY